MADEMQKIVAPQLISSSSSAEGLYLEWNYPYGAAYIRVTVFDGPDQTGTVVYQNMFDVTVFSTTVPNLVVGWQYTVELRAYPIEDSEKFSASDEFYSDPITYNPSSPPPNPLNNTTFKIRDYDDDGVRVDYIGHNWTTFITDTPAYNVSGIRIYIKKKTDSEYTEIIGVSPSVNRDVSGTNGDFDWEAGIYGNGYYPGWFWLNFTNLEPLTTYVILAEGELSGECYPLINGTEIEWTTTEEPIQTTQLAKPSINAYPRATGDTKYTTLQIRLTKTIDHATSYEYQIALDSDFTDGVKTRTSSTVTSGYPMSGYFTGLTSGTKYYCRARALSSDPAYTTSEWSNVTNTRVTLKLPAPTGLAVTDITESSSVLRWDEVENASKGYTVRWRKEGASEWNTDNV